MYPICIYMVPYGSWDCNVKNIKLCLYVVRYGELGKVNI